MKGTTMHSTLRRTMLAGTLAAAAFVAAGCGDDSDSKDSSAKDTKTAAAETSSSSQASEGASNISSPGVDLRVTLDRLLAEHAALAYVALTKTIAGEADAKATVAALQANTDELSEAVGSVYGDDAAQQFQAQWEAHIGMFVNYATAVAKQDAAGKAKAKQDLAGYQKSFAAFLSKAAGLDARAAEAALGMHVQQLTTAIDQYGAGNYAASIGTARDAYEHMFKTGDALAAAITKQKPEDFGTGSIAAATADTRVLLDRQLGEHAFLATLATTKALAGAKDASAIVAALDQNTVDLGNTIKSVYGAKAEQAFLQQWRAHNGYFVDYTTALAKGDDDAKAKAADDLEGYVDSFAAFLAQATDGDEAAYKGALAAHVQQLAEALDAAKGGDADRAWDLEREAYAHMFMTGDAIVSAIVAQNPDMFAPAEDPNPSDAGSAGGGDHDSMG
jgi:hypothetical protein